MGRQQIKPIVVVKFIFRLSDCLPLLLALGDLPFHPKYLAIQVRPHLIMNLIIVITISQDDNRRESERKKNDTSRHLRRAKRGSVIRLITFVHEASVMLAFRCHLLSFCVSYRSLDCLVCHMTHVILLLTLAFVSLWTLFFYDDLFSNVLVPSFSGRLEPEWIMNCVMCETSEKETPRRITKKRNLNGNFKLEKRGDKNENSIPPSRHCWFEIQSPALIQALGFGCFM